MRRQRLTDRLLRYSWAAPSALFLIGIVGTIGFIVLALAHWLSGQLTEKVGELTYQFLLLVVVGGGVSFVVQWFTQERERRERNRTQQRDVHTNLITIYNQGKKVRRLLRARAIYVSGDRQMVRGSEYDTQLRNLIETELALELAIRGIAGNEQLFPTNRDTLAASLKKLRNYANAIISEYEEKYRTFSDAEPSRPLADFPKMLEFIGPAATSPEFQKGFKGPFHDALDELGEAMGGQQ